MIKTLVIPIVVGLLCFVVAAIVMNLIMPYIPLDDAVKGLIKIGVWIVAFTVPSEYLRKKAKQKKANEDAIGQIENTKLQSKDRLGITVVIGDSIKVLGIDERILASLPEDELRDLKSFIGGTHEVIHINSDESMVVSNQWSEDHGCFMGHEVAIFPVDAEKMSGKD